MRQMKSRGLGPAAATFLAIAALCLIVPATSLAQSSSVEGYGGEGGEAQAALAAGEEGSGGSAGPAGDSGDTNTLGTLPLTGLDLAWMIGGGALLVVAGLAMGRSASRGPRVG